MKEALLIGRMDIIGEILHFGWQQKKLMAVEISNPLIDKIYETALAAGSSGGKISGAGGGGFMVFYCPMNTRNNVINKLKSYGGEIKSFIFVDEGLVTWTI